MALPLMTIDGDVVAVHSHWTEDGSRIVTDATVRTPDGRAVVVRQLGGTVDGIGMITFPGPEPLKLGMKVAVAAHRDLDLSQREHIVLDSAKVLAYPPGYVRTGRTRRGSYLYWESGCVFVTLDSAGTTALAGDQEFGIIDASMATWNEGTASCSYISLVNDGRASLEVGNDKVNLIKFRDTSWCRPATKDDPIECHSTFAAAVTTAIYIDDTDSARDGAIIDADVEINGVNFAISVNQQSLATGSKAELQNTLTHELGHLLGLEHPCRSSIEEPERFDNLGVAVPVCQGEGLDPPLFSDATMYNFAGPGETKKETLSADDILAVCEVYPSADDPGACEPVGASKGGCCSTGRQDRSDVSLLLAGLTAFFVMRRRKTTQDR